LVRLYPQAKTPPVTIAVGRGKPVGVGSPVTGLQIGLEALCSAEWMILEVSDPPAFLAMSGWRPTAAD
jgi:hypothetical protein